MSDFGRDNQPNLPWKPFYPVFKYVDVDDAKYLKEGSLKFGTLRGYGNLKSARRDKNENTSHYNLPNLDLSFPPDQYKASILGLDLPSGNGIFHGNKARVVGSNHYCFCTSYRDDLPDKDGIEQAVFRIDDIPRFIRHIVRMHPFFGSIYFGLVHYGQSIRLADSRSWRTTNPFTKTAQFADEHEVRFLSRDPCPDDAAPITGPADREFASLLKRIR
jgi:hypothetical protein